MQRYVASLSPPPPNQILTWTKQFRLDVRYGAVTGCQLKTKGNTTQQSHRLLQLLEKKNLHDITNWEALFAEAGADSVENMEMAKWVQGMLSIPS